MFIIRKKTLFKKLKVVRDRAQRDMDKTGDIDSHAYYEGIVDTCNDILFEYDTWGS